MMEFPKTILYDKIAKVFDALTYLQKEGAGQHAAVAHDAARRAMHRECQRNRLLFFPSERERTVEPHIGKGKDGQDGSRNGYLTTIVFEFKLVCRDTGEEVVQVVSGQGHDSLDSGSAKAWSKAIKTWILGTFLIEAGFNVEVDDDDEPIDKDAIEKSFARIKQDIHKVAPSRAEANQKVAEIIGYYKTHSKRPVEDPREFQTRAHAKQAYAALEQVRKIWAGESFEREAKSEPTDLELDLRSAKESGDIAKSKGPA